MIRSRVLVALLCLGCAPAPAQVYKSIGPGGVASFSNLPPDPSESEVQMPSARAETAALRRDPVDEERLRAQDAAVQRANALLDQAERALALARHTLRSVEAAAAGYAAPPRAQGDKQRVDFYKREVLAAQRLLVDALKHMRGARGELTPGFEAPAVRP